MGTWATYKAGGPGSSNSYAGILYKFIDTGTLVNTVATVELVAGLLEEQPILLVIDTEIISASDGE